MSRIVPDIRPQYYTSPQTITWTVDPAVSTISSNVNGIPPAISEYIAYDTLSPPNPFLAVTQDGKGNVVYDGGFPKFYNSKAPAVDDTTFSQLTASFKFLYNALTFTANPDKVAQGNRSVLVIGDAISGQSYSVKDTTASSFRTSFERLCAVAGFTITIKDRSDWGGTINPTFTELDQYACVLVMASDYSENSTAITDTAVQDIVTYREQGNGIILITDHGPILADLTAASQSHGGFFTVVNRIAVNFGAYFTDNYDRTPVNVGFLRSTYGDHPLYNGMSDAEDISAGGSESRVVVTEVTTYDPTTLPQETIDTPGKYVYNFLMILDDGSVETHRLAFTLTEGEFIYARQPNAALTETHELPTYRRLSDFGVAVTDPEMGTVQGIVVKNDVDMGTFTTDTVNGTVFNWYVPDVQGVPTRTGDRIGFRINSPVEYYTELTVTTPTVSLTAYNLAANLAMLETGDLSGLPQKELTQRLVDYVHRHHGIDPTVPGQYATMMQTLVEELTGQLQYPEVTLPVADTLVELDAELDTIPTDVVFAYSLEGDTVKIRETTGWQTVVGAGLRDYLEGPRTVVSSINTTTYSFDGTVMTAA